jgi:hypothetical protein
MLTNGERDRASKFSRTRCSPYPPFAKLIGLR